VFTRIIQGFNSDLQTNFRKNEKKKESDYMSRRRITSISNLLELLENNTITITCVQCKTKAFADITETDNVTPERFVESIQYLNEATLFKDSVDFYYEFSGKNGIRIKCGMQNPYLNEYFYADCMIKEGVSVKNVESKLRETIFHKMDKKITA